MAEEVRNYTLRAMAYAASSLTLLVLSLVLSSELLLVGSLVIGAIMLLSLTTLPGRPRVTAEMDRTQVFEEETVRVDMEIDSRGSWGNIEVFHRLSPNLELDKGSNLALLPPGRSRHSFVVKAPLRGYHPTGPTLVRRWDPLWLWYRESASGEPQNLTVFPAMHQGRQGAVKVRQNLHRPGEMKVKRIGSGKEFHSIRGYTTTDPFNTINWKAFARTGKLQVNQYETETVTDVMFFIDARLVGRVGLMTDNPVERSIRLCASLSSALLNRSNRVGLVVYGRSVNVTKPKGGPGALQSILHILTDITPSGQDTLGSSVTYALSYLSPNCPILILSSLAEDPTVKEAVRQLVGRGHPTLVVSPSGVDFERMLYSDVTVPKYLLKKLSRENLLMELGSMGARVVDWHPGKDVQWALMEVWE